MTFPLKIVGFVKSKVSSDKILITMTPTALFTVGFKLSFASGAITMDWKDGSPTENFVDNIELTHQYVSAGTNIAEISGDLANITAFNADHCRITDILNLTTGSLVRLDLNNNLLSGTLNMSKAPISSVLIVQGNSDLNGFNFASSGNGKLTAFYFYDCDITGRIDFDAVGITVGSDIRGYNNNNFTGIDFATSGNTILTNWRMYGCAIVSQDFTNVPVSGILWFYDNFVTTTLTFAAAGNGSIIQFYADDNILPNIDFSVFNNSTPTIRMFNNSLTATEHDNQIINLDATGWINGTLNITAGNTARTAASDTAYNNLISNGWSIT